MAVNLKGVGTVWEFIQRLSGMPGSSTEQVGDWMQRIVDNPYDRQQASILVKGDIVIRDMSQGDWIDRETARMKRLTVLPSLMDNLNEIPHAWHEGCGYHDHYVPHGWTMLMLCEACRDAGIKMGNMVIPSGGANIPLERGTLRCDLGKIMQPTAPVGNFAAPPFMMTSDRQVEWAESQGGKGITSVEETLYLILTAYVVKGRMPFMGGWIRCRNSSGSGGSLDVGWDADGGLEVDSVFRGYASWNYGAVPREFRSVDA